MGRQLGVWEGRGAPAGVTRGQGGRGVTCHPVESPCCCHFCREGPEAGSVSQLVSGGSFQALALQAVPPALAHTRSPPQVEGRSGTPPTFPGGSTRGCWSSDVADFESPPLHTPVCLGAYSGPVKSYTLYRARS